MEPDRIPPTGGPPTMAQTRPDVRRSPSGHQAQRLARLIRVRPVTRIVQQMALFSAFFEPLPFSSRRLMDLPPPSFTGLDPAPPSHKHDNIMTFPVVEYKPLPGARRPVRFVAHPDTSPSGARISWRPGKQAAPVLITAEQPVSAAGRLRLGERFNETTGGRRLVSRGTSGSGTGGGPLARTAALTGVVLLAFAVPLQMDDNTC